MTKLSAEAYAIVEGRHSDPFHYLGLHKENDKAVVRVFLPEASNVDAIDEHGKLGAALNNWRDRATETFLGAYREILGQARLWPGNPAAAVRLLNFFLLEKAIYEIEYELAHRPDWLRVPLTGALRILSQQMEAS